MNNKTIFFLILLLFSFCLPVQAQYGKFEEEMLVAEDLLDQSKANQAIAVYKALILKDPKYVPAYLELATVHARKAEYVDAEKAILKILNSNKKSAQAYERLAYVYFLWSEANPESRQHLLKKALAAIEKALELDKYNEQIYTTYSLILMEYKKYDEALSCLNKALDINPTSQVAFTNKGILYTKLDKYNMALQHFEKAIHVNTSEPRPYRQMAIMLADANQERQAVEYLNKARFYDIFITYQDHYLMAILQEKLGNLHEAIDEFTSVLAQKPKFVDCYTHIARLSEALGDDKLSIESYRKAVALDYNIMEGFITQAEDYLRESDFLRARPLYLRILKIEPGNRYAFEGLCSYHYLRFVEGKIDYGQWYEDKEFLAKQIPQFKENTNLLKVSWVKFHIAKHGLDEQSKAKLVSIMNLDLKTPEDFSAKGEALFLYQNYTEANKYLHEAIDKYVSYYTKGDSYDEAIRHLTWAGDRLYTYHEVIASKATYNKVIELGSQEKAVDGLTELAGCVEEAEILLGKVFFLPETPSYDKQVIERLQEVIRLYPQSSKAHFLLSRYYAIVNDYENALKELLIYKDLYNINPYKEGPKPHKVDKIMKKYFKILNAQKRKESIKQ